MVEDWKSVMMILKNLSDSGKTIFSMDSSMISTIEEIAAKDEPNMAVMNAASIINLVYGKEYEIIVPGSNGDRMSNLDAKSDIFISNNFSKRYKIFPNPVNESVVFVSNNDSALEINNE